MSVSDCPDHQPDDPLDTFTEPGLHWTRANVGEAMPGCQTPLSWTFWAGGIENAMRESAFSIGALTRAERQVPADPAARVIRIFRGRVALNVEFMTMIGDRMPGTTGAETARSLIGAVPADITYTPTRRRYPVIGWRLPKTFLGTPRAVRRFATETDRWYRQVIGGTTELDRPAARAQLVAARRRFDRAVTIQTVTVMAVIQPLYEALGRLISRAGTGEIGMLSGSGGAEMAVVSDIWKAAHGEIPLHQVIARHGFHGPVEGEMSSRVWRDDPEPLRQLLARYAERDNPDKPDEQRRLHDMQARVVAALPRHHRPLARLLLRLCETRIPGRGVLKRSFLQCFDVARASARRLGDLLAADGVLDDREDVFYLTVEELTGARPVDPRAVVAYRRARHHSHQGVDLPAAWTGRPMPITSAPPAEPIGSDLVRTLRGTGVSAGVAEGVVRVLTDPCFDEVEDGEILVAPTTDPSWASIMFISAGLVIDIGGALSHAAVVAREMGIPCVVSTSNGTVQLHTGDRVRIDGTTGTVDILERNS
jgi:pyruvate,water dikinase